MHCADFDRPTLKCFHRTSVQFHYLLCGDISRYDVIEKYGFKLLFVLGLEQRFDRATRQFCKSLICWREDRERAFTRQSVNQSSRLQGSRQSLELTGRDRGLHDVGRLVRFFWTFYFRVKWLRSNYCKQRQQCATSNDHPSNQ